MPDPKAQIPTPDELIGPGIDALVALRPRALPFINSGKGMYAAIFAGWRGQAVLMVQRLADFAKQGRLALGSGEPLSFLIGSEFDTLDSLEPTKAIGHVVLTRSTGSYPGGPIPKGARISRSADTSAARLFKEAQYEVAETVYVPQGLTSVTVPLVAMREGTYAGRPPTSGATASEITIADEIVDKAAWVVSSYEMGGGSEGASDDDKRRYARAFARGKFGPTTSAAVAGALKLGARHVAAVDDATTGTLVLYVADGGWASSTRWANAIRKSLYDPERDEPVIGYGCKVTCALLQNEVVGAECTVRLREPSALAETSDIDASIQKAIRSFFDDRDDFHMWRSSSLRGIVARADPRILSCSAVTIKRTDGTTVSEPTAGSTPKHYMLAQNSVRTTYQSPI